MDVFVQPLYQLADFEEIIRQVKKPGIVQVSGCLDSQKAHFSYGVGREFSFRLILAENDLKAREFYEDYRMYDPKTLLYPSLDLIFYQADIHGNLITRERLRVIRALMERQSATVVASIDGCMDCLLPLSLLREHVLRFRSDSPLDLEAVTSQLVELGYELSLIHI